MRVLTRLVHYARPYVGAIAIALVCAVLYTGARNLRAWLIKPILDEVVVPAETSRAVLGSGLGLGLPALGTPRREVDAAARTRAPGVLEGGGAAGESPTQAEAETRLVAHVQQGFWKILLAGLIVVLVSPLAEFGKNYLNEWVLGRVLVDIQSDLCRRILSLPLSFHHERTRGDVLSRTLNDVSRAHRALDLLFADVITAVIALLVGGGMLLAISWRLALISLLLVPPIVGVVSVFGRRIRRTARRRQERIGDVTQRLVEILAGIKVVKAFRAQQLEQARFTRDNQRLFRSSMRVVKNRVLAKALTEAFNNGAGIGLLVLGVWLLVRDLWGITIGDLAAFVAVLATTYAPTKDLARGWTELMDATPAAERFFELLDASGEPPDVADAVRFDGVRRDIRFEKVSFSYGREPVLRDVSLEVPAGEVVAVVGRTGAGKTTLVDLLLRFHDPDAGAIEIDGVDLRRIARDSFLDGIAVVSQEPFLFAGTIRENIAYGRPGASEEEILAAAHAAHVDEFANALPEGFETDVGEEGVRLSGGQRQRITIARAILRNPAILVFDEATSSLDAKSERAVREATSRLMAGRTVFVIAHRLSTIRHADRIVLLENGTVSRVGTHDELMADENLYRELVNLQLDPA